MILEQARTVSLIDASTLIWLVMNKNNKMYLMSYIYTDSVFYNI